MIGLSAALWGVEGLEILKSYNENTVKAHSDNQRALLNCLLVSVPLLLGCNVAKCPTNYLTF